MAWVPKNWCFWIVVLEKTLESPLDSKEIHLVHPKGNQSWIFIGRTDAEAETPILWPPGVHNWFIWKDPDAGKDWKKEEMGVTARSQCEELRPWQRSWGRRLSICKGGIQPQESPWKFSSIYPQNQNLPTLLICALTYTSDFTGGCPPPPSLSLKKSSLTAPVNKVPGRDKSVSTHKLLWKSSSLPE